MDSKGFTIKQIMESVSEDDELKKLIKSYPDVISVKTYGREDEEGTELKCKWMDVRDSEGSSKELKVSFDDISSSIIYKDLESMGYIRWRNWMIGKDFFKSNEKGLSVICRRFDPSNNVLMLMTLMTSRSSSAEDFKPKVVVAIVRESTEQVVASFYSGTDKDAKLSLDDIKNLGSEDLSMQADELTVDLQI
jgi:hypothetical protein